MQEKITDYLAPALQEKINKLSESELIMLEELRLRSGKPLCLRFRGGNWFLSAENKLTQRFEEAYIVTAEDLAKTLMLLSQSSFYALEEELRRGYITLPNGHRAGICGHAVLDGGKIRSQRDISSINLRVAKAVQGSAAELLQIMMKNRSLPPHTLIISPPGCGKTTVLRDIASSLADVFGLQIGIVDERSEIAALGRGRPQLPVGRYTDVLDGCPKAEGMMLMLRSMSPQVLICDEIGRTEDKDAVLEVINGGVKIIATAHGGSRAEILSRPVTGELLRQNVFEMVVLYSRRKGPGTLEQIWNEKGAELL